MLGRIIIGIDDRYRCWQFYSRFANIYTFDKKIQMLAVLLVLSDVGKSMYRDKSMKKYHTSDKWWLSICCNTSNKSSIVWKTHFFLLCELITKIMYFFYVMAIMSRLFFEFEKKTCFHYWSQWGRMPKN